MRYLTHPQVDIDPQKPVPEWSLSNVGRARIAALAQSGALTGTTLIVSSAETKAVETAAPLAETLGIGHVTRDAMHENDRSATGFLPPTEFETVADAFFAKPDVSVRGWETARAAQARIVAEVRACLSTYPDHSILFVGHGGVGTLLYCHLAGKAISRAFDQGGGGGCYFDFPSDLGQPRSGWQSLEVLVKRFGGK